VDAEAGGASEGENRLRIAASRGKVTAEYKERASLPLTSADGVLAEAIRKKGPVIIPDIHDKRAPHTFIYRQEALAQGWRSFMAVPMLGREEEPIGALSLYGSAIGRFDESEGKLMQSFANQAAVAFQQQKRLEAMQRLAQVGQSLSFDQTESDKLLTQIAELARHITGADCTVIYPYDPVRQTYFAKETIVAVGLISEEEKEIGRSPAHGRTGGNHSPAQSHRCSGCGGGRYRNRIGIAGEARP
jgi:signal transduction protein with GAF and PtsI domain